MIDATTDAMQWAQQVLLGGALNDKLRAPPSSFDGPAADTAPRIVLAPARDASIAISADAADKLPRPGMLKDADARAQCLSRFAHHELQAVELFAWVVLACPHMPPALLRGILAAAAEEQTHLRLYLERLHAHDVQFGALALSGYFWKHIDAIAHARDPLLAFLCAQGLTLEQANLDFTLLFRDGFRAAGDLATAAVCQRVHDDEVGHVKLAAVWVARLSNSSDVEAYAQHAPFPYALARAKARRFDVAARTRAGLSVGMIDAVRAARPYA